MAATLILIFVSAFGYLVMKKLSFAGGRRMGFGGKIRKTVGSVEGQRIRGTKTDITVHALDRLEPGRAVGLELAISTDDGDAMYGCKLSVEAARKLASLLESAAGPGSGACGITHPGAPDEAQSRAE